MYRAQMTKQEREPRSKLKAYISHRELIKGSLTVRKQKCGKPNCKCAHTDYRHICLYLTRGKHGNDYPSRTRPMAYREQGDQ